MNRPGWLGGPIQTQGHAACRSPGEAGKPWVSAASESREPTREHTGPWWLSARQVAAHGPSPSGTIAETEER